MVQTELTNIGSAPLRLTELRSIDVANTPDCRFSLQGDWRRCGFYIESNQSSWAGVKRLETFADPVEVMASEQQGAVPAADVEHPRARSQRADEQRVEAAPPAIRRLGYDSRCSQRRRPRSGSHASP